MRYLKTLLLLALAGCSTPSWNPHQVTVSELEWGVYADVDGETQLVEVTDQIPCRPDAHFGARLLISFPENREEILPLKVQIREPEIPGIRPPSESRAIVMPKGISSLDLAVFDEFKGEFDLVDGEYVVVAFHPETGLAYYSRTFYLRDCEHSAPQDDTPLTDELAVSAFLRPPGIA